MSTTLHAALDLLGSENKLERERGLLNLKKQVVASSQEIQIFVDSQLENILPLNDWKQVYTLISCIKLIASRESDCLNLEKYTLFACKMLEHSEPRIRDEAGLLIEILAQASAESVYNLLSGKIISLVKTYLVRQDLAIPKQSYFELNEKEKLFHDTSGWIFLESSMNALKFLISGCGNKYIQFIDINILMLLFECSTHINRFVRETCMFVLSKLIEIDVLVYLKDNEAIVEKLCNCLLVGMSDNWSQVRFAASTAARLFLLRVDTKFYETTYRTLLPAIGLNRHYLADGVRSYNVDTWNLVSKGSGARFVSENMDRFINFYVSQATADNHAVREAACHCLAELGFILSHKLSEIQLDSIYSNLLTFFNDESWPVRDTACLALGVIASTRPEFFYDKLVSLYSIFSSNLADSIPSVRLTAARAFCRLSNSFSSEAPEYISKLLSDKLESVKNQEQDVEKYQNLSKKPAVYGVIKQLYDNDSNVHSDKVMYSCGSLAPKMKSRVQSSGCSGHGFVRDSQPWEVTDGCITLMGELCSFYSESLSQKTLDLQLPINSISKSNIRSVIMSHLPLLSKTLEHKSFALYHNLLDSFLKYLPSMIKLIGHKEYKEIYESQFAQHLSFASTQQGNDHLKSLARDVISSLR